MSDKNKYTVSEKDYLDIFSDNLRELMESGGWTQQTLSEDSGISQASISGYLNGTKMPGLRSVQNICIVLGISLDDLLPYGGIIRIEQRR